MIRRPPRSTRTDTLFPYTTLFRSVATDPAQYDALVAELDASDGALSARTRYALSVAAFNRVARYDACISDYLSRSEEHTSELQSLMRISYAVFCLKKKNTPHLNTNTTYTKPDTYHNQRKTIM